MGSTLLMRNGSMMVRGMAVSPFTTHPSHAGCPSRHIHRIAPLCGNVFHGSGALQLVPRKRSALDGTFQGLEQNDREDLAIGKALQPHLAEQPAVFTRFRLAALQS